MKEYKNILLTGGSGRNTGKTTFLEMLIRKFSTKHKGIALKTSMLLPGQEHLHGNHKLAKPGTYSIVEEYNSDCSKDSCRFKKAGAYKSYFMSLGDGTEREAFKEFLKITGNDNLVVIESNSLRNIIIPALFIMIVNDNNMKPSSEIMVQKADIIIPALKFDIFKQTIEYIDAKNNSWVYSEPPTQKQESL